ncbi:MAG: hypothetical protein VX737_06230 [Pseudomonadota bacterium]|nr:hypothetical protein [Pseudomonadota bacterium]
MKGFNQPLLILTTMLFLGTSLSGCSATAGFLLGAGSVGYYFLHTKK